MKIGILTFHRAYNYGAVLQCYALKEVLRYMGHDVSIIDYRQPEIESFYKFRSVISLRNVLRKNIIKSIAFILVALYWDLRRLIMHKRNKEIFENFQKHRLSLSEEYTNSVPYDYDIYIIGSDMLWAYDVESGKFDPIYLGEFRHKPGSKIIGYAISGTPDSFGRLGKERNFSFIKNFDAVSVREKSLAEIVRSYTNETIDICIDPTLLTTKELWSDFIKEKWAKKRYIVTYYLRVSKDERKKINKRITQLKKARGFEIINIDVYNTLNPIDIEDFVSIIRYAQYVITDSFHGVVFSLIFEKPFHALKLGDSHDARYVDILHTIGADYLVVGTDYDPEVPQVDYKVLNERIEAFRSESMDFLKRNI